MKLARNDIFELNGLTDLQKKLEFVADKYPYESEELLQKMGNKFRKAVKEKTPDSGRESKQKLMKSYKVSKVQGTGKDLFVEFRSTSPHFHLIERGHKVVVGGKLNKKDGGRSSNGKGKVSTKRERVEGKFMVKETTLEFQNEFPQEVEKMVNRIVRKLL